jgi:hypothetical protein
VKSIILLPYSNGISRRPITCESANVDLFFRSIDSGLDDTRSKYVSRSLTKVCFYPFMCQSYWRWVLRISGLLSDVTFISLSHLMKFMGTRAFCICDSLRSICIPGSVEFLGKECFVACSSLTTLIFESGSQLTEIQEGVFSGCSSLNSICIPSAVRILRKSCFGGCSNLCSFTFDSPSNLEKIDGWTFTGCELLNTLCIPASLTVLSCWSLYGLHSLASLTFEPC